jgi:diguanylate cyclase (GGDEF)-like protein
VQRPENPEVGDTSTESQLRPALRTDLLSRDRGTLTIVSGPNMGAIVRLDTVDRLVIGRGETATFRIEDPGLSRNHAAIVQTRQGFWLEDLKSKNGTFIETEEVEGQRKLQDGDRIQIGQSTLLRFSLQDPLEQEAAMQVYEWTMRDPLTGLYNRRFLDDRLKEELAFAARHQRGVSALMIDIDHFKEINDAHGHQAGDLVLSALARFLERALRTEDVAARYGGEEFIVVVRDIGHDSALVLADRIRASVQRLHIPNEEQTIHFTVSVGVATLHPGPGDHPDCSELLQESDQALYRAKSHGRNRVSD